MSENINEEMLRFAGDVNVDSVVISSDITNNAFNIKNQLIQINIFEDMFSPFITGELIFRESNDFINNFPFVGEESLEILLQTPTLDEKSGGVFKGKFRIYKLDSKVQYAERNSIYIVKFISKDATTDLNKRLSRSFSGKISDIAEQLIVDKIGLGTKTTVNIETTSNNTKYVSNYWTPIRNINYITEQARNSKDIASYVFFENRYGYNFVSLDALNSAYPIQKFENVPSGKEISPSGGSTRVVERDYSRIVDLRIPVNYDYMKSATNGTFGSVLTYVDLLSKRYTKSAYSYFDDFYDQVRLNKFPISSSSLPVSYESTMLTDITHNGLFTGFGDVSNVKSIQSRISRLRQAQSFKIEIDVAGRFDYTVGSVVIVTSYKSEPVRQEDDIQDNKDKIISGSYLISAINHIITRERHDCTMELIKDSMTLNLDKVSVR